jgi:hypothetical protein
MDLQSKDEPARLVAPRPGRLMDGSCSRRLALHGSGGSIHSNFQKIVWIIRADYTGDEIIITIKIRPCLIAREIWDGGKLWLRID